MFLPKDCYRSGPFQAQQFLQLKLFIIHTKQVDSRVFIGGTIRQAFDFILLLILQTAFGICIIDYHRPEYSYNNFKLHLSVLYTVVLAALIYIRQILRQ